MNGSTVRKELEKVGINLNSKTLEQYSPEQVQLLKEKLCTALEAIDKMRGDARCMEFENFVIKMELQKKFEEIQRLKKETGMPVSEVNFKLELIINHAVNAAIGLKNGRDALQGSINDAGKNNGYAFVKNHNPFYFWGVKYSIINIYKRSSAQLGTVTDAFSEAMEAKQTGNIATKTKTGISPDLKILSVYSLAAEDAESQETAKEPAKPLNLKLPEV